MPLPPLVVFVAPSDPRPDFAAMVDAARATVPEGTRVAVSEREPATNADVVVVVRWADDAHSHATLTVRLRDGRFAARSVAFDPQDPDLERGRTLGFAAVAMIPDDVTAAEPAPSPERPVEPAPAPGKPDGTRKRVMLDLTAQGALAAAGSGDTLGGAVSGRLPLGEVFARVGAAARFGTIAEAKASVVVVRGDVGVGVSRRVLHPDFEIGARGAVVLVHYALARTETDGGKTAGSHTLAGADIAGEGGFWIARHVAIVGAVGTELAFGTTRVLVGSSSVAVIPPVRLLGELGVRVQL
jgi:hypothetical protein